MKVYVLIKCMAVADGYYGSTDASVEVVQATSTRPETDPEGKQFPTSYPAVGEYYRLEEVELDA